jgi:tripartite-type tricarboxylate transporter receptor subunit TctC
MFQYSVQKKVFAHRVAHLQEGVMKLPRRSFLHLAASAAALPAVSRIARAQSYPARPVRMIVGLAAGGGTDIAARLFAQWLSDRMGKPFIIENRPGAGGNVAAETVVRSPPDGYTLLVCGVNNAVNETLYDNLSFNFINDIAPVAGLTRVPYVLEVNPSFPAKTVLEFIAYAKANPGKVSMGSAGTGTGTHVAGELFKIMTGINMVHVPYRSAGPALADLLGGQVQVVFGGAPESMEFIRAGKLRALAVTTATRVAALPDVPTVGDFVTGYEASGWYGIGAPKRTPTEINESLNKEIIAALADSNIEAHLTDLGAAGMPMTPYEFGKLIAEETEKWGKVIRAANIKVQ